MWIVPLLLVIWNETSEGAILSQDKRAKAGPRLGEWCRSPGQKQSQTGLRGAFQKARLPGFTLLELAVVLLIIGLVLAIAMPHFGAFQGAEIRSEAHRLAARSYYLDQEAGAQKVLLRLNFDLNHSTYFVTRLDPFAAFPAFTPETGPAGGIFTMPSDVRLRDVWVEGGGLFSSGVVRCQFYPSGSADAAVIHLLDRNGDVITLGIDPFNGEVAIVSGDLSPRALQKQMRQ
jgi:prepilin-type N-terminal cleavage/methylation domain-containing protein